jgi:hypothetical protein
MPALLLPGFSSVSDELTHYLKNTPRVPLRVNRQPESTATWTSPSSQKLSLLSLRVAIKDRLAACPLELQADITERPLHHQSLALQTRY